MDTRAPVHSYVLEFCELRHDQETCEWRTTPPSMETVFRVDRLNGNRRHLFRVRAINEAGVGDAVEIDGRTSPTEPGVVGNVAIDSIDGLTVMVSWDPPVDDGGTPILSY